MGNVIQAWQVYINVLGALITGPSYQWNLEYISYLPQNTFCSLSKSLFGI